MATGEMAAFLRARRDGMAPASVGLAQGGRRRAPGLRRAEVAQLAGISPDYYMRLEQGRARRPSPSVLDGLAGALHLNDDERDHLYRLARAEPSPPRRRATDRVDPSVLRLLELLGPIPAYVLNGRLDVLAWNSAMAELMIDFGELEPPRRNLVWFAFGDPRARSFYVEWEKLARQGIAQLRTATGRDPGDRATRALIAALTERSAEFREWWPRQDVKGPSSGRKVYRHPEAGVLTLDYIGMLLPGTPDHQFVTYTAPAGSPSQEALDRLTRSLPRAAHPAPRAAASTS